MTAKVQIVHDTRGSTPCDGHSFFHCQECLEERPLDVSPMEWARQQVAITSTGAIQVRCTRHDLNISVMTPRVAKEVLDRVRRHEEWRPIEQEPADGEHQLALYEFLCENASSQDEDPTYYVTRAWVDRPTDATHYCPIRSPLYPPIAP